MVKIIPVNNTKSDLLIGQGKYNEVRKTLIEKGYGIVSLEEAAMLRIQEGVDSPVCYREFYTKEHILYYPYDTTAYMFSDNVELESEIQNYSDISWELADRIRNSERVKKIPLPDVHGHSEIGLQTREFKNNEIAQTFFGEQAENYGLFLKELGVEKIVICLSASKRGIMRVPDYIPPGGKGKVPFLTLTYIRSLKHIFRSDICSLINFDNCENDFLAWKKDEIYSP